MAKCRRRARKQVIRLSGGSPCERSRGRALKRLKWDVYGMAGCNSTEGRLSLMVKKCVVTGPSGSHFETYPIELVPFMN